VPADVVNAVEQHQQLTWKTSSVNCSLEFQFPLQQVLLCWWILLGMMWHRWNWSSSLYWSREKDLLI